MHSEISDYPTAQANGSLFESASVTCFINYCHHSVQDNTELELSKIKINRACVKNHIIVVENHILLVGPVT